MMRIGLAGIATESSSFTEHRTKAADFQVLREGEILDLYGYRSDADLEWVPLLRAVAPPGGAVEGAAYDALEEELLDSLAAAVTHHPLDGLHLDLHGAMLVSGRNSAEEALLRRIRAVVGPKTVIAVCMDPHGNLSREFVDLIDIATCHRHSPHIDNVATRDRAANLLRHTLRTGRLPAKAWVRVPVLLAGERTSTLAPTGRTLFVDSVEEVLSAGAVWEAAVWVGRAWADEERCAASVLVLGDDEDAATAAAQELASHFWDLREAFGLVVEPNGDWEQALAFARSPETNLPLFLSDSGDNVTAGGSGDITYAIHETRRMRDMSGSDRRFLFAGLVDRDSVEAAAAAGEGATLSRGIGAVVDTRFGSPVDDAWRVEHVYRAEGEVLAAMLVSSSESVLVQSSRSPFVRADDPAFSPGMLQHLAPFDIADHDVIVVKNGYLFPSQVAAAGSVFLAITPGGSDLDFGRLEYRRRPRPMYPLDTDFSADLSVRVSPSTRL